MTRGHLYTQAYGHYGTVVIVLSDQHQTWIVRVTFQLLQMILAGLFLFFFFNRTTVRSYFILRLYFVPTAKIIPVRSKINVLQHNRKILIPKLKELKWALLAKFGDGKKKTDTADPIMFQA